MATDAVWSDAPITLISAADLSEKAGFGYEMDSDGKAILATAGDCEGVIINGGTASGDPVTVLPNGCGKKVKVVAGAAFNEAAYLTTDANGKFIATTTAADLIAGKAIQDAAADLNWVWIFMGGSDLYAVT